MFNIVPYGENSAQSNVVVGGYPPVGSYGPQYNVPLQ